MKKIKYPRGKERSKVLKDLEIIDYKDTEMLKVFIDMYGRIVPRRYIGLTVKKQKELAVAIKRSRIMGLLPFVK